jgi:hypothetical protein
MFLTWDKPESANGGRNGPNEMEQERVIEELDEDALPSNPGLIPGAVSTRLSGLKKSRFGLPRAKPREQADLFRRQSDAGSLLFAGDRRARHVCLEHGARRSGQAIPDVQGDEDEKLYLMQKLPTQH